MRRLVLRSIGALAALLIIGGAQAAPITFLFEGTVDYTSFSNGTPDEFGIGDTFSMLVEFDSTEPDRNADTRRGFYDWTSLTFTVGTYSGSATGEIYIEDDYLSGRDMYNLIALSLSAPDVLGLTPGYMSFDMRDNTGTVFSDDSLPLSPPDLGDFNSISMSLKFNNFDFSANGDVELTLNSITAVPVPAAVWLFGSALGLLGWMRRRQN
jgi:hypothetical protein